MRITWKVENIFPDEESGGGESHSQKKAKVKKTFGALFVTTTILVVNVTWTLTIMQDEEEGRREYPHMETVAYLYLGGVVIPAVFVSTHKKMRKHARRKILQEWLRGCDFEAFLYLEDCENAALYLSYYIRTNLQNSWLSHLVEFQEQCD